MATRTYDIWVNEQGQRVRQSVTETIPDSEVNAETLRQRASTAIGVNAAYLALGSPTAAQTTAQVQRLTRECTALIRLLVGALDDDAGT